MNTRCLLLCGVLAAVLPAAACNNQKYVDLTTVSGRYDAEVDGFLKKYEASADPNERGTWRDEIINRRTKQLVMMQRIDVETMPAVKSGEMTRADGEKRKAELVAAAQRNLDAAKALKVGTDAKPAAAPAAPAAK
jgi:hypothetical protein